MTGAMDYSEALYHSPRRYGLFVWYPFRENARILEVGGEHGALSDLFLQKAEVLTVLEPDADSAREIADRYGNSPKIRIIIDDLFSADLSGAFDYIILRGEFELTDDPSGMLEHFSKFLQPDGKILLAVHNRLSTENFSGAPDLYSGIPYDGLNGSRSGLYGKTYDLASLLRIVNDAGLYCRCRYYVSPSIEFPEEIFTDDTVNTMSAAQKDELRAVKAKYSHLFDESALRESLRRNSVMGVFADGFLLELGTAPEKIVPEYDYIKVSLDRKRPFAIYTGIDYKKDTAVKIPIYEEGIPHLEAMAGKDWRMGNFSSAPVTFEDGKLISPLLHDQNLSAHMIAKSQDENEWYLTLLKENLMSDTPAAVLHTDEAFQKVFGDRQCSVPLHWRENLNIDLIPGNVFCSGKLFKVIDCEWIFDFPIPVEYVLWRSVPRASESRSEFFAADLGLDAKTISVFESWEKCFLKTVTDNEIKSGPYLETPIHNRFSKRFDVEEAASHGVVNNFKALMIALKSFLRRK